ncbi:hypothetical protein RHSP_75992 [Rhizobium freirei PRF 81]|uniref:Uncharacterized protein n=1 Tax=Rhizobium freirei PRF 81 TaxID=363754 RepID=N6VBC6_9HYPH|nr:hypothetical protein RHSP_75992 [Rhizobium freirei PRF 81]
MHCGVDTAGLEFHVGVVYVRELAQFGILEIGFGVVGGRRAGLDRQRLAFQVDGTGDLAIGRNHQQKAAVVVAIGKVDDLLAFVLDGDARKADIDLLGLQGRNDAVKVHRLKRVADADILGDGIPQVDIEADILVALLEFERHEGCVGGDDQILGLNVAEGDGGGEDADQQMTNTHFHGSSPCCGCAQILLSDAICKYTMLSEVCRIENLQALIHCIEDDAYKRGGNSSFRQPASKSMKHGIQRNRFISICCLCFGRSGSAPD